MHLPRQNTLLPAAANSTTTSLATFHYRDEAPKAAITVAIALALVAIGFGISRLLNRCYKQVNVTGSSSNLSDHTKQLLKLQKTTRRRSAISQAEMQHWQMTVLSMWRNRPSDEDNDDHLDGHGQMLQRLRDAWFSRRRCHHATGQLTSETPGANHAKCSSSSSRWATPEELDEEVRRVARAWLEFSRSAEASAKQRDRRRRSAHNVMMRRLSSAWRERGQALDRMRTIEETADASSEDAVSFVPFGNADHLADPDSVSDQTFADARDTDGDAETRQPQMPAVQGAGGYCRIL